VDEHRLTITITPDGWVIEGELDRHNTDSLLAWCESIDAVPGERILELAGLEILDAEGIAATIETIRRLLQRNPALIITHAPHLLSHTLYRIGLLEGGRLSLIEPRQEEPYG